ncbi:MAG: magnesium-translocating P-type ATPase [Aeriscardovia sp.]|nr:magnesium-translocating P-type ATPase [Aeriscardovia sp.]
MKERFASLKRRRSKAQEPSEVQLRIIQACREAPEKVLASLGTSEEGLTDKKAALLLKRYGPNELAEHKINIWRIIFDQAKDPIMILLFVTGVLSFFLQSVSGGIVICVILALSLAIGTFNEWRSQRTADSLKKRISHSASCLRDGVYSEINVEKLVPGDIVRMYDGEVVPADVRLLKVEDFSCDESALTGESRPAKKSVAPDPDALSVVDCRSCALMGTIVREGSATGVVVATGSQAELGSIACQLASNRAPTDFQIGIKKYSNFLMIVAFIGTLLILIINGLLNKGWISSALFAFSVAIGITPELLPVLVSTSLTAGSRMLAKKKVLVKQLMCIEDLGGVDVLVTDKTGTITNGHISFNSALGPLGADFKGAMLLSAICSDFEVDNEGNVTGGNDLDIALGEAMAEEFGEKAKDIGEKVESFAAFNHITQVEAAVAKDVDSSHPGSWLFVKGAPEKVLDLCKSVPEGAEEFLTSLFKKGLYVIAVAEKKVDWEEGEEEEREIEREDEEEMTLVGYLTFLDQPKPDVSESIKNLRALGIEVKIATGDNALVAQTVCEKIGLPSGPALTNEDFEAMSDEEIWTAMSTTAVFARVTPEQKQRVVSILRQHGRTVAFLGDGVNDALALHKADVGISVDTAVDVAKDAAGIILLDKDLNVMADGVKTGRRIFTNTIKYVNMCTSSNFGGMFSTVGGSFILPFLPMTGAQVLLQNLIYDVAQMVIPGDRIDKDQEAKPTHWDIKFIYRFMVLFGPISSIFDYTTFALMIFFFHAWTNNVPEFHSGWFIESFCSQTLIVFIIRTRRLPFWKSRPSRLLTWCTLGAIALAIAIPYIPVCDGWFGLVPLPAIYFPWLVAEMAAYILLCELAKWWFYKKLWHPAPTVPIGGYPAAKIRRKRRSPQA